LTSPEFIALRDMLATSSISAELADMRQSYDGMGEQFPISERVHTRIGTLGGRPCEWFEPNASTSPRRVVLYFHGGGYCMGSLKSHRHMGAEISRLVDVAVVILDYRLGPENPFPAAIDDGLAAYEELLTTVAAGRIAFAGDSSGGGLLVAVMQAIASVGLAQPSCGYCMSPWIDLECTGSSMQSKAADDPWVTEVLLKANAARYISSPDERGDPRTAPLNADLRGLASLLIQVGTAEVLMDDSVRLAGALGKADCGVRLEVWPKMFHVWQHFFPTIPEGKAAIAVGCEFLRAHFDMVATA
jgi:monoterpene epsilon-lactone hydrolase